MFDQNTNVDLKEEQKVTLDTPRLKYNFFMKTGFLTFDLIYGKKRILPKFKVLEILARIPYWAWENISYDRLSKMFSSGSRGEILNEIERLSYEHIELGRNSQDNEQWHMVLLDEMMQKKGMRPSFLRERLIPVFLVFGYYFITRLVYRLNPAWSFDINAAFEDHAEHEYMLMVQENPDWDNEKIESKYKDFYPVPETLGDLIRRIGLDERIHKEESIEAAKNWRKANK